MKAYSKRLGILLIAALLLAGVIKAPAQAAEEGEGSYTYTIRLFPGKQGSFAAGPVIEYTRSYGDQVTLNYNSVRLNDDSKYYVKGVRESGRDNNSAVGSPSFTVTGDRDYVVAYGLRGNMVAYVVNYLDLDGNSLAPAETYYGNVGDKPVIAFLYIDGYQPQAYNLTKTLSENEAENVFTFVYSPIEGPVTDETVVYEELPGTTDSAVQVIEGETRGRTRTLQTPAAEETDEGAVQITPAPEQTEILPTPEPLDTLDLDGIELDDTAVPLGNMKFKLGPIEMDARLLLLLLVIIADIAVVAAASVWYWKPYRKKKANEKKEAAQPV